MTDDGMLTLTHATERDVDLLLIEELKCSPAFVGWLSSLVSARLVSSIPYEIFSVAHSKRRIHNRREIDITLLLIGDGIRTIILIENKLDTAPQPLQAESYREESTSIISRGEADRVFTVLVSPKAYASSSNNFASKFDCFVSYEEVVHFLSNRASVAEGELRARLLHRSELLQQAITKARRGYQAVPMVVVEEFNAKYINLFTEAKINLLPGPSMLKEGRPGESKTMIFAPDALPRWSFLPQTRLVHQLREGNANINLYGWGGHFSYLAVLMAPYLAGTAYRPVPTVNKRVGGNSGLMIVADTPAVDNLLSFDEQREAILEGMKITEELRNWFSANKSAIEMWAKAVEKGF